MLSHNQVWSAIDGLAQDNDMSVSRLARNAGLDPTTFNKSKRVSADGRLRWPSTESLHKIMQATGTSLEDFMSLMQADRRTFINQFESLKTGFAETPQSIFQTPASVPLLGMAQAGSGGFFDEAGLPQGEGWDAVEFPQRYGEDIYALEISGDSMLPLYRDGDRIIVDPSASIRRGDRVVVRTLDGEVMAKVLARKTAKTLELESLNPDHEPRTFEMVEIDWVARIVWASQ
ncbi:MAG: helix-turn-helix transcriptional regulator [Pseudomonadota bacterium]